MRIIEDVKVKWSKTLYTCWHSMKRRCRSRDIVDWRNYGARGIKVCDRWLVFENFAADMGEPPIGFWLDRIDNDKGYEPSNCRWVSPMESGKNQRRVRYLTINGETLHLSAWYRRTGISPTTLLKRKAKGKSDAEMLVPVKPFMPSLTPKIKLEPRISKMNRRAREIAEKMGITL